MKTKRLFSLLVCLMLMLSVLPLSAFAARGFIASVDGDLEITGTPNSVFPIGQNYYILVKQKDGTTNSMYIKMPNQVEQVMVTTLDNTKTSVNWNGITVTRDKGESTWVAGMKSTFNVVEEETTVVGSSNAKLIGFNPKSIEMGQTIDPRIEIIDYNMEASQVHPDMEPYMTGYSSNDSFALTDAPVVVTVKKENNESGKYCFEVTFKAKYTGKGNRLAFTMAYRDLDGMLRTVDCSITIPGTREYIEDNDDDDEKEKDPSPLIPYIIVDSYDYGGGTSVTAGDEFTLTLRLRNTSSTHALTNVVMNIAPKGVFSMAGSSNTYYIEQLGAGSMIERKVTLNTGLTKVTDDKDANGIDFNFAYQYMDVRDEVKDWKSEKSSESITIPVNFPDRFELGVPEIGEGYAGEECYISIPMVNKGRSGVYNLTARIEGEGMANPGQSQFAGNLNAGTESTAEFSVKYNEGGDFVGNIIVTYEDANMNPKEAIMPFNITVQAMDMGGGEEFPPMPEPTPELPVDTEPKEDPVKKVMIVVGVIVCLMSAYLTIQKAKAKRSLFVDEDI